jgi:hypothetical protein
MHPIEERRKVKRVARSEKNVKGKKGEKVYT